MQAVPDRDSFTLCLPFCAMQAGPTFSQHWVLKRNSTIGEGRRGTGDSNGAYAVAATAWLRRFSPEQFLWLETAAMRQMSEIAILTMLGDFLCLPTAHLRNAPGEVLHACKSPSAGKMGQVDQRMKTHALESLVPADFAQRLTSVYRPFNRLLASILSFRKFEKTTAQTVLSAPWLRA
uniref:Uncharacterized protein n=1 Tax=Chrysotila carterae TaxID=13221 RepID=A0A7S4AZG4_CHRCT